MRRLIFVLLFIPLLTFSQSENLIEVPGLPTKEVFDLLVDSNGFLWVSHNFGLSRYDGSHFTHYSHDQTQSMSMFDLVEDKYGRIWGHNFVGQVYYIENEEMNWYKDYDYTKENQFPRMALLNDEIVITSMNGLFVCDVNTLKGKYIVSPTDNATTTNTLHIGKNEVIALGQKKCYRYVAGQNHLQEIKNDLINKEYYGFLSPTNCVTPYVRSNPSGILIVPSVIGNRLVTDSIIFVNDFINGVTEVNGETWIHSKKRSFSTNNEVIEGYNISDVVVDKEGNTWFSSLERGLLLKHSRIWQKKELKLKKGDFVRQMLFWNDKVVYGTQHGKILINSSDNKQIKSFALPPIAGNVEFLKPLSDSKLLIASSYLPYLLDLPTNRMDSLVSFGYLKDIELIGNTVYIASTLGILKADVSSGSYSTPKQISQLLMQRAKSVRYNPVSKQLLASVKNGLYFLTEKNARLITFKKTPIYSSSIESYKNKFLISSYVNGLFIIENGVIRNITTLQGLSTNMIVKAKLINNHLWLIGPTSIDVVDVDTEREVENVTIPPLPGDIVYDLVERNDSVYISTNEGIFSINMWHKMESPEINNFLLKVLANNQPVNLNGEVKLSQDNNNLQVFLSAPIFTNSEKLYFKYKLFGSDGDVWRIGKPGENIINYSSLLPGKYTFEAYAVHPQFGNASRPVVFTFEILTPWYQTWWFALLLVALVFLWGYNLYRNRIRQLKAEDDLRRKIAVDLHDDIGSTLSSINIYSTLAKTEKNHLPFINHIQEQTKNIISALDELVWNINPKNDSAKALIEKLESYAYSVLPPNGIRCEFKYDDNMKLSFAPEKRRSIFLAFKEMLHNVVKHSECTFCYIEIQKKGKKIELSVADNGKGLFESTDRVGGDGLENLSLRAKELKGSFLITSDTEKGTTAFFSFQS